MIIESLGLDRSIGPEELSRLADWLRIHDLDTPDFADRLSSWFANFARSDDKKLAARLLVKFAYYSPQIYDKKLSNLGVTLSQTILDNADDLNSAIYIVDDNYLDSSGSLAYYASKHASWSISSERVRKTSELSALPETSVPFVVLNDTQGSGNQFAEKIWPHLQQRVNNGTRLYVACLEISEKAISTFRNLSDGIVLVPDVPTANCLDYLMKSKYVSSEEAARILEWGKRANPTLPLGYGDCALLSAYHYQCPNNTLSIFWGDGTESQRGRKWNSLFSYKPKAIATKKAAPKPRLPEKYGSSIGNEHPSHNPTLSEQALDESERLPDLRELIQANDWIIGAVNFDEDLHFSSFYLRASCKKYMAPEHRDFGYSSLIAVHQDFNETYYIPRDECIAVADALLSRIKANPTWLQEVLNEIGVRALALSKVFPYERDSTPFRGLAIEQLESIYQHHNESHRKLYEVARIPEALDRGVGLFEAYLMNKLREKVGDAKQDSKLLNSYFHTLTFPEAASQIHSELLEFRQLVREIQKSGQQTVFSGSSKRTVLKLDQKLRSQIDRHRDKWSFWGYHGYGSRALLDLTYYLDRIASELSRGDVEDPKNYTKVLKQAELKRVALIKRLKIDSDTALMYRLHSRIGLAKLLRRYHQLRNFYFLDQLLDEIARRLGVPEALVRSLLPNELEDILSGKAVIQDDHYARIDHLVYVIHGSNEAVFAGSSKCTLVDGLLSQTQDSLSASGGILTGTSASGGIARGRCKKVIRKEDAVKVDFSPGDILVSESTDMDLYELIRQASGVITEAGGVSCHAAIVCRELNKPAIVGVRNALQLLENNELVLLDANEGTITPSTVVQRSLTIEDIAVYDQPVAECGQKARALSRLLRACISVPRFFVIPWSGLRKHFLSIAVDADGAARQTLIAEIKNSLEYLSGDMFVIRSSMSNEDTKQTASAGMWPSEIGVLRSDLAPALIRYIERFKGEQLSSMGGSIIVQEMVLGDASGVCFTNDPTDNLSKRLVLEVIPGGNELLTDGQLTPMRYFASRETREVSLDEKTRQWGSLLDPTSLRELVDLCLEVEAVIGEPQDIEWTIKQRVISILQARWITTGVSSNNTHVTYAKRMSAPELKNVSSMYRAYRVPPNLQLHLLRVAALGNIICDNWDGAPLDRTTLISTLLLHDVGNIVKADYDRFPDLFPEEMKNLAYWKEVQRWVRHKYGQNDVEASLAIAREFNVSDKVLDLMARKLFVRNTETSQSTSWELKIAAYADQRVGPHGVLPLEERFTEAKRRYKGVDYASVNHPEYETLVRHAYDIETQISKWSRVSLQYLSDEVISTTVERLRAFDFEVN